MPPSGIANAVMFHTLVQGVILGIALVACAWLLVNRLLRLNASTRFAVWFSLLIVVAVITVLPATRRDDPQPVSRRTAVARRAGAVPVALPIAETKEYTAPLETLYASWLDSPL